MLCIELVPLLERQRELYEMPRGFGRFRAYLATMIGTNADELQFPPLVVMNPMGKQHVFERLNELVGIGAEDVARTAAAEAQKKLADHACFLKVGLVVADDVHGGWTNRYFTDMTNRFENRYAIARGWVTVLLWASDAASRERVREEVLAAIMRTLHLREHGPPKTLERMMRQEGAALAFAGRNPALDDKQLGAARRTIARHSAATDYPTIFACLYGDEAAVSVGYSKLGVPACGGFEVALADALSGLRL